MICCTPLLAGIPASHHPHNLSMLGGEFALGAGRVGSRRRRHRRDAGTAARQSRHSSAKKIARRLPIM
jgi:hypothetical protein